MHKNLSSRGPHRKRVRPHTPALASMSCSAGQALTVGARVAIAPNSCPCGSHGVVSAIHHTTEGVVCGVKIDAHGAAMPTIEVSAAHLTVVCHMERDGAAASSGCAPGVEMCAPTPVRPRTRSLRRSASAPVLASPVTAAFRPVRSKRQRDADLSDENDEEMRRIHRQRPLFADEEEDVMYKLSSGSSDDDQDQIGGASSILLHLQASRPLAHTPASVTRLGVPGMGETPGLSSADGQSADDENSDSAES